MSRVVADAGPLMALAKLNLLHLLKALYDRIEFSQSVFDEIITVGLRQERDDAHTLQRFFAYEHWTPTPVESHAMSDELRLDKGEIDSIVLAKAQEALLLIDEERGREIARRQGLAVRGTLGVLVQAYRKGHLSADQLQFYVEQIITRPDIWISPSLCRRVLHEVLIRPE